MNRFRWKRIPRKLKKRVARWDSFAEILMRHFLANPPAYPSRLAERLHKLDQRISDEVGRLGR